MRDASLKQRIPCIIRISIFGAFSAGKKCALYTGKYGRDIANIVGIAKSALYDILSQFLFIEHDQF